MYLKIAILKTFIFNTFKFLTNDTGKTAFHLTLYKQTSMCDYTSVTR